VNFTFALDQIPDDYSLLPDSRLCKVRTRTAHHASRCAVRAVALMPCRRRRQYLPWLLSFGIIGFGLVLAFFWSYALAQRDSASAGFDEGILSLCPPISLLYG
jgi:hypothetical protein